MNNQLEQYKKNLRLYTNQYRKDNAEKLRAYKRAYQWMKRNPDKTKEDYEKHIALFDERNPGHSRRIQIKKRGNGAFWKSDNRCQHCGIIKRHARQHNCMEPVQVYDGMLL